jgi:hypothetical protein
MGKNLYEKRCGRWLSKFPDTLLKKNMSNLNPPLTLVELVSFSCDILNFGDEYLITFENFHHLLMQKLRIINTKNKLSKSITQSTVTRLLV